MPAERGHVFRVGVGRDCEPLWIGLCRYPASVRVRGRELRVRVQKGAAWRLSGFSKTQYASLHGWEYFRRCHVAIVDFLAALRPLGFDVKISDEGHYWPRRSERALRAEVDKMNRLVAAAAGAMKDAEEEGGGRRRSAGGDFRAPAIRATGSGGRGHARKTEVKPRVFVSAYGREIRPHQAALPGAKTLGVRNVQAAPARMGRQEDDRRFARRREA